MSPEKESLLNCESLCVGYAGRSSVLAEEFSFALFPGEVVALMGENGSGKSTLLKTFAGSIPALSGCAMLCRKPLGEWSARERACRIALVRMAVSAPDRMTVREFVGLGRSPYSGMLDGRSEEDIRIIESVMGMLDVDLFADRPVVELSDGERSRVYLAQAVAQQVKVLLLDEPNAFLDIPRSHALFRLLKTLAESRQMGIIVSTHSVEYAERYCDRIMVIDKRQVRVAPAKEARASGLLDWTGA